MVYIDAGNQPISPQENPYAADGCAQEQVGLDVRHKLAMLYDTEDLVQSVSQALKDKTAPIRLIIAGEHGSGKSHRINLVCKEFLKQERSICIPIKTQDIYEKSQQFPSRIVEESNAFRELKGGILNEIISFLEEIEQDSIARGELRQLLQKRRAPDYIDLLIDIFKRTKRKYILLMFDEVEFAFAKLGIKVTDFVTFLHVLSERLSAIDYGWGICIAITPEHLLEIKREAAQLQDGRYKFIEIKRLRRGEVREYVCNKNRAITRRISQSNYPFDEEVLDLIADVSSGLPRYIETLCHEFWRLHSDEKDSVNTVNITDAKNYFIRRYRNDAFSYFERICSRFKLSSNVEVLLKILFLEGGYQKSLKDLCDKLLRI